MALERSWKTFLEIRIAWGGHTRKLIDFCNQEKGKLLSIDPKPANKRIQLKILLNRRAKLIRKPSLEVLPNLKGKSFDCVIIDGDHNWYTVYNELQLLEPIISENGAIFLHDISWPYGRRDLYYCPERIPPEFRHPYAKKGIIKGQSELAANGGHNPDLNNATLEGGPRNGVLTAIEDFMTIDPKWNLKKIEEPPGLGILTK